MQLDDPERDARFQSILREKPELSASAEAVLFAKAEEALAQRRARLDGAARRVREAEWNTRRRKAWLIQFLSIHPDLPAVVATAAAGILAFLALHSPRVPAPSPSAFADFPQFNNASARYDAQRLAEQLAYEREVENAHQQTSGGI